MNISDIETNLEKFSSVNMEFSYKLNDPAQIDEILKFEKVSSLEILNKIKEFYQAYNG